jgi:hypothetical protein
MPSKQEIVTSEIGAVVQFALRKALVANERWGSNPALRLCWINVRFTAERGRVADIPDRQVRARSRPYCSIIGHLNSNDRCVHVI